MFGFILVKSKMHLEEISYCINVYPPYYGRIVVVNVSNQSYINFKHLYKICIFLYLTTKNIIKLINEPNSYQTLQHFPFLVHFCVNDINGHVPVVSPPRR